MIRKVYENRPLFITICAAIVALLVAAGFFIWYMLSQPPTPQGPPAALSVY